MEFAHYEMVSSLLVLTIYNMYINDAYYTYLGFQHTNEADGSFCIVMYSPIKLFGIQFLTKGAMIGRSITITAI